MSSGEGSDPLYCIEEIHVLRGPALAEEGWEQRTVSDPTRIDELDELYTSLGFETKRTSLDPTSFGPECTACAETACSNYIALFTRRPETH